MDYILKKSLIDIMSVEGFSDSLIDLVSYSYDASDHDERPEAAVWPTTAEQVSGILVLANEHLFPVVPRGAGTGLAGGAVPIRGGLVLDMCRMNKIVDVRIEDRSVVVEPGVVYSDLQKVLFPHGYFFPPDPASGKVCTLGGNAATNASGLRGAKYGTRKDYVIGLEVVLPDGRVMRTGLKSKQTTCGVDLTGLIVGSEGTLGVITNIYLRILPKPPAFATGLVFFESLDNAGEAVADITTCGVIPSILEILDENSIQLLKSHGGLNLPDVRAMILCETDGFTEVEARFKMDKLVKVFKKNRATNLHVAEGLQEVEKVWRARKLVGSIAGRLRPNNVSEDVTVPISQVPRLLAGITTILHKCGFPFVIFGHAGDGNLHPKIMYDRSDTDQARRIRDAVDEIFTLTCALGGTLSGEHGIGVAKSRYMNLEHDVVSLDVMRSIKKLFDPNNILNPGKIVF